MFKINKLDIKSIFLITLLFQSNHLLAGINDGDLEGFYVPQKGWSESHELYPGESIGQQLGQIKVVLKRQGWDALPDVEKSRIRKRLVLRGILHGVVDNQQSIPLIEHEFSNQTRDGALYSTDDAVVVLGVESCSSTAGGVVLNVLETVNIERGSGIYQDLQSGGTILLEGTINSCTSQNDFEVVQGSGGLCFGSEVCE